MAAQAPTYDLLLLLSEQATDEQRAKVLTDVQSSITTAGGQVDRNDTWGRRPTTYEIRHEAEAEYHLLQFKSPPEFIAELSHTLHITDGVLRFRVIKNRPGTPPAPSSPPPVVAPVTAGATSRGDGGRGAAAPVPDDEADASSAGEGAPAAESGATAVPAPAPAEEAAAPAEEAAAPAEEAAAPAEEAPAAEAVPAAEDAE